MKNTQMTQTAPHIKTSMLDAVRNQDILCLKQLIDQGSDVNEHDSYDWVPVTLAARLGHTECLALLIQAGADVNTKNNNGWTPAMLAAANGHRECLAFLVDKGVNFSIQNRFQKTALILAQERGAIECIEMIKSALEAECLKASLESLTPHVRAVPVRTFRI